MKKDSREPRFALPGARGAILWSIWIAVVAAGFLAQFIERARPMLHHR